MQLNGQNASALIVSANLARRHLSKTQQAMALAMIYPEPEKGGCHDPAQLEGQDQCRWIQTTVLVTRRYALSWKRSPSTTDHGDDPRQILTQWPQPLRPDVSSATGTAVRMAAARVRFSARSNSANSSSTITAAKPECHLAEPPAHIG